MTSVDLTSTVTGKLEILDGLASDGGGQGLAGVEGDLHDGHRVSELNRGHGPVELVAGGEAHAMSLREA